MNAAAVVWRWGHVDASDTVEGLCLAHRAEGAQAWVREGRVVRGTGYERASRTVRHDLARSGAIVRLRQRGRYLVHAAGAVDLRGRAWLLAGDSGCGKSTLAYALARSGWTILGDDGVLIEVTGGEVTAHSWRGPLEVSTSLVSAFPELAVHVPRARPGDPRQRVPMTVPLARGAQVAAMVFVDRAEQHSIAPLGPMAALSALVRQSPWVIIQDAYARVHLDALRRTAMLPCFHLEHTPAQLHTIAQVLAGALP